MASLLLMGTMAASRPAIAQCVGDCSEDMRVTIDELVTGTNLALGTAALEDCAPADGDASGAVSIDELIVCVKNSIEGCPGSTPTVPPPTETPTATATATPTLEPGPIVTYFGLLEADNSPVEPTEYVGETIPLYVRTFGSGFILVVETTRGPSGRAPGVSTFEPSGAPFLQIASSQALGNGSEEVCDAMLPNAGGVPASPSLFDDPAAIRTAVNDFSCRFVDGTGDREARFCGEGCVRFETGVLGCMSDATHQFCAVVDTALLFPPGETTLTARVLDVEGTPGASKQLIVRVVPP